MLTFAEKKVIIYLFSIIGSFRNPDFWKHLMLSKEARENIPKAIEATEKIAAGLVTTSDCDGLARDVKRGIYKIECLHNGELAERHKRYRAETMTIKRGDYEDMIELLLEPCNGCTRLYKRCELRKILKRMKCEPLDPTADGCEYCVRKGVPNERN